MANLMEALADRVLLGDGATGSYLYGLGVARGACLEEVNLSQPDLVRGIHRSYVDAGSNIIMTNSFGANRLRLARFGMEERVAEINAAAVRLAREEVGAREVFVGGSVGPLMSKPTEPELSEDDKRGIFREHFAALLDGGVDAVFIENFSDLSEILLAWDVYQGLTDRPAICGLAVSMEGRLLSGQDVAEAWSALRAASAPIVGLNATVGPMNCVSILGELEVRPGDRISVYPNAGKPEFYEGYVNYSARPEYFASLLPDLVAGGARLIGGDYGTGPEHIAAMAKALPGLAPIHRKPARKPRALQVTEPLVAAEEELQGEEPSLLDALCERVVHVVELDSPKSLAMSKFLRGARALKDSGADAITLADNSLAILRVSNLAAGVMLRDQVGISPLIHLACRDRNLLGIQSELMGLAVLGFRHVLALTGDPAKVGDHPGATNVYDLNSVKLIKLINEMNSGHNAVGGDLRRQTKFLIGCAFNPNARNFDSQLKKLESKMANGAQYALTQPVFEPELARKTGRALAEMGMPCFTGIMPLLHSRNAEFLHNEVPGIKIPDPIRERLRHAESEKAATGIGLELARELREAVLETTNGLYLITPFLRYELSQALIET
ncbi:MAG: bifunctional homocysteine S-methyltransferase/methylenetetrahydrofolate reductase [Verrucomicrobiota bacterium]